MPRLTANVRSALADWWDLAAQAGYGDYTTTDVIQAAADLAEQFGRRLSFGESSAIATLYGYARRMSNASGEVQDAEDEHYIESKHIAVPPWARDEREMNTNPMWHVSYQFRYIDNAGVEHNDYKTSVFETQLPDTIGALKDALGEDAEALASKYGVTLVGVDLHQILAV